MKLPPNLIRPFLLVVLIFTSGCVLELAPSTVDCVSTQDCGTENVCFFGRCVDPGYNISEVYVDLYPSNSSQLLPQSDLNSPRNLDVQGLKHDFVLQESINLEGIITTSNDEQHPGILTATPLLAPGMLPLPSTQEGVQTAVGSYGFNLGVVPGEYDLHFQPDPGEMPRPPMRWPDHSLTTSNSGSPVTLDYPADSELQVVHGRLLYSSDGQTPIVGADIRAILSEDEKDKVVSTVSTTLENGQFSLTFGPDISSYSLSVSPGENLQVPTMLLHDISITTDATAEFILGLEDQKVEVAVQVIQANGSPEPDANVVFWGTVGSDALPGTYSDSMRTDSNGFALTELFPGLYTITAVPLKSSAFATQSLVLCVASQDSLRNLCGGSSHDFSEPVQLNVPQKQRLEGVVRSTTGHPIPNARVSFARREDTISREFTTTTNGQGQYGLYLDPAHGEIAYELTVEPPASEGQPRYREILPVSENPIISHDIVLYPASFVYGCVLNYRSEPIPDVVISFYSTILGTEDEPLLVGLGRSTENGEFVIALPRLD